MSGIRPDFAYWRQCDALAIWQLAALMREVDPRAWAAGEVAGSHGDALELDCQQDQLIAGVYAGTLQLGTAQALPPTRDTYIVTSCVLSWLKTHDHPELADQLDRSLHVSAPETLVKKSELIKRHQRDWPSIEEDLKRASNTDLATASEDRHGIWNEAKALAWASKNGKLRNGTERRNAFP